MNQKDNRIYIFETREKAIQRQQSLRRIYGMDIPIEYDLKNKVFVLSVPPYLVEV